MNLKQMAHISTSLECGISCLDGVANGDGKINQVTCDRRHLEFRQRVEDSDLMDRPLAGWRSE
jgi:hypothetical protein